jgi:hypothetical protein
MMISREPMAMCFLSLPPEGTKPHAAAIALPIANHYQRQLLDTGEGSQYRSHREIRW